MPSFDPRSSVPSSTNSADLGSPRKMTIADRGGSRLPSMSTRVAMMDGGRIVEYGTPQQIFAAPREERTRDFVGKILKH